MSASRTGLAARVHALRPLGSARTRNTLVSLGIGCGALGCTVGAWQLTASVAPELTFASLLLGGVGLAMLVGGWSMVLPHTRCAFCDTPRARLSASAASDRASICQTCAAHAVQTLLQYDVQHSSTQFLGLLFEALPPRVPWAVARALEAQLDLGNPTVRRRAVLKAFARDDAGSVIQLIGLVPEGERSSDEWVALGIAQEALGHLDEAIASARRSGAQPALVANNVASAELERAALDQPVLVRIVDECEEARRQLAPGPDDRRLRAALWANSAEALLRLGRLEEAEAALAEAERCEGVSLPPSQANRLRVAARIAWARGNAELAKELALRSAALLHPESPAAARALALAAPPP